MGISVPVAIVRTKLACPICRSHRRQDYALVGIAAQPYSGGVERYEVLRCLAHGIEFADALPPPMTDDQRKGALDGMYGSLDGTPRLPRYADFMDRVARVRPRPGILHDVGCGNGHLLIEARRRGWTVQGNDIVEGARSAIQAKGIPYFVGSLSEVTLPAASCDVVTSYCVLPHHLADPIPDLEAVVQILAPGGWLVAELPTDGLYRKCARLLYGLSGGRWRTMLAQLYGAGGHQFAYDATSVQALLKTFGFTSIVTEPFHVDPKWSLVRFGGKPIWLRAAAAAVVYALHWTSRIVHQPNHIFVYAQRP